MGEDAFSNQKLPLGPTKKEKENGHKELKRHKGNGC
jgi:hypothetical protein